MWVRDRGERQTLVLRLFSDSHTSMFTHMDASICAHKERQDLKLQETNPPSEPDLELILGTAAKLPLTLLGVTHPPGLCWSGYIRVAQKPGASTRSG